jgi:hypothetical protein
MEEVETNPGYVYLMRNKSMPAKVKIGSTMGDPNERANQLSKPTGIPEPFEVVGQISTPWPRDVELEIHRQLSFLRVSKNREFFIADITCDKFMASNDEINQYFMLFIAHAVEEVELRKRREAIDREYWEMQSRHESERQKFLWECMKKNCPERAEEVRQQFRQPAEGQTNKL